MTTQDFLFILIAIVLGIIAFYLFIWLLPVIIVLVFAFIIYQVLKGRFGDRY